MEHISEKLKERFCKDCSIPIKVFAEPYFTERIKLFDPFYGTTAKWERFVRSVTQYGNEQDYFAEYNRVKDAAIKDIKESEGYQKLNTCDMQPYAVKVDIPDKAIFQEKNDKHRFLSIDMRKANFSALRHYDPGIFNSCRAWEEFIGQYTKNPHIIYSKYIREVILGNCNPKRHITYEKFLMHGLLEKIQAIRQVRENIVFFANDEIIIDTTGMPWKTVARIKDAVKRITDDIGVPFKIEIFKLYKIDGTDGYYKKGIDGGIEFKCLNSEMLPFVAELMADRRITEHTKIFCHEGRLAKFIEVPEICVPVEAWPLMDIEDAKLFLDEN